MENKEPRVKIGIIGEFKASYEPHTLTLNALMRVADFLKINVESCWIGTKEIANSDDIIEDYHGLWISPGSPYESFEGALIAINYARVNNIPLFGTCAGFQHMILEFAINVCGIKDALSTEYGNLNGTPIIDLLECRIAGEELPVNIKKASLVHSLIKKTSIIEKYYCSYGLSKSYNSILQDNGLKISGTDIDGEPRIIELPNHPFFVASLFVPEDLHPLIVGFIKIASKGVLHKLHGNFNR